MNASNGRTFYICSWQVLRQVQDKSYRAAPALSTVERSSCPARPELVEGSKVLLEQVRRRGALLSFLVSRRSSKSEAGLALFPLLPSCSKLTGLEYTPPMIDCRHEYKTVIEPKLRRYRKKGLFLFSLGVVCLVLTAIMTLTYETPVFLYPMILIFLFFAVIIGWLRNIELSQQCPNCQRHPNLPFMLKLIPVSKFLSWSIFPRLWPAKCPHCGCVFWGEGEHT